MALVCCILGKFLRVLCHCFPPRLDVPTFAARYLHVRNDVRGPSSERWNYGRERMSGNFTYMASLFNISITAEILIVRNISRYLINSFRCRAFIQDMLIEMWGHPTSLSAALFRAQLGTHTSN